MKEQTPEVVSGVTVIFMKNAKPFRYMYAVPCGDLESFVRFIQSATLVHNGEPLITTPTVEMDFAAGELTVYL